MEQNTEKQETEAKAEESVQNDENLSDTDTNAAETDSKDGQQTENVADSAAEKASEAEKAADQPAEKEEDWHGKYDELNDKYLRLMAEFDNYRKRTLKEKMDLTKYAEEDVLKGILKVVDDMERAINNLDTAPDMNAVKEGVELIYKKFKSFLETRGLKEVEAMHQDLDTDKHEAVAKFTAPSEDLKGKIIDVVEKGYYLHDKIIRYAKVVIGE
ncbi:MAG: nucleotide exchange factor GrpE [Bacteroidales bacterium]|jgi:molecular chaperone GrpE|nr:nucleotide exchange factor GrpE [Bacteroidales bacterium]MBQ5576563.1 nucleotide exchange factor GrpE [Bacteroidales bacterium]